MSKQGIEKFHGPVYKSQLYRVFTQTHQIFPLLHPPVTSRKSENPNVLAVVGIAFFL